MRNSLPATGERKPDSDQPRLRGSYYSGGSKAGLALRSSEFRALDFSLITLSPSALQSESVS